MLDMQPVNFEPTISPLTTILRGGSLIWVRVHWQLFEAAHVHPTPLYFILLSLKWISLFACGSFFSSTMIGILFSFLLSFVGDAACFRFLWLCTSS